MPQAAVVLRAGCQTCVGLEPAGATDADRSRMGCNARFLPEPEWASGRSSSRPQVVRLRGSRDPLAIAAMHLNDGNPLLGRQRQAWMHTALPPLTAREYAVTGTMRGARRGSGLA